MKRYITLLIMTSFYMRTFADELPKQYARAFALFSEKFVCSNIAECKKKENMLNAASLRQEFNTTPIFQEFRKAVQNKDPKAIQVVMYLKKEMATHAENILDERQNKTDIAGRLCTALSGITFMINSQDENSQNPKAALALGFFLVNASIVNLIVNGQNHEEASKKYAVKISEMIYNLNKLMSEKQ